MKYRGQIKLHSSDKIIKSKLNYKVQNKLHSPD